MSIMQLALALLICFSHLVPKVDGKLKIYHFTLQNDTRSPGRSHCPNLITSELNEPQLTPEQMASPAKYI